MKWRNELVKADQARVTTADGVPQLQLLHERDSISLAVQDRTVILL